MDSNPVGPNHSWTVPIDNLMQWRANKWVRYFNTPTNLELTLHCDQLIIHSEEKVAESLSLNGKIKAFFKADVMIMVLNDAMQGLRKLKFQLKSNASQCLEKLAIYFPVLSHDCVPSKNTLSHYNRVEDVVKRVLKNAEKTDSITRLPPNFTDFVKLCLVDPAFPQFIQESQKIIESLTCETK